MAIAVATEGPKLAAAVAEAMAHAKLAAAKHPHDEDIARVMEVLNYLKSLNTALTADNDTTFDAVFTATTIET